MSQDKIESMLSPYFLKKHVLALIQHFKDSSEKFHDQHWEDSIAKGGKFIEAVLKALHVCATTQPAPAGKLFKAETILTGLTNLPKGTADDSIRVLIPRACRFVYEVSSNRGGRHDPDEIDPNEMDATASMTLSSWILAEMIRLAQKGAVNLTEAQLAVAALLEKKLPLVEEVDGRIYFHGHKKGAPDVALVILSKRFPVRIKREDLIGSVEHNGFTKANAAKAVSRTMKYVDDGPDGLLLLATGRAEASKVLHRAKTG